MEKKKPEDCDQCSGHEKIFFVLAGVFRGNNRSRWGKEGIGFGLKKKKEVGDLRGKILGKYKEETIIYGF